MWIVCIAPTSPIVRTFTHIARRINGDARRHAGADAVLVVLLVAEAEANRQALHDADEVAGGVVWREQREHRPCAAGNALDPPVKRPFGDGVHRDCYRLADTDARHLLLAHVGD